MKKIETRLLREKFTIVTPDSRPLRMNESAYAMSNRVALTLPADNQTETYVIRAQNMHICLRLAAQIAQSVEYNGSLIKASPRYNWEKPWNNAAGEFETTNNKNLWAAVYSGGQTVFKFGERHALLDLVEKFTHMGGTSYDESIRNAEATFQERYKKPVRFEYEGTVAMNLQYEEQHSRIGIILRSAERTTMFSFSLKPRGENILPLYDCLNGAADFLEGIQLAYVVGNMNKNLASVKSKSNKESLAPVKETQKRLSFINGRINAMEDRYIVGYRPERPNLAKIVEDAEALA